MPSSLPSIWSSFELENKTLYENIMGFPCGSAGKESTSNAGDLGSILDWEDPLKKGKATYFSILIWRIPWTL